MQEVLQFVHTGAAVVNSHRIDKFIDVAKNLKIKGFHHLDETESRNSCQSKLEKKFSVSPPPCPPKEGKVKNYCYPPGIEVDMVKDEKNKSSEQDTVEDTKNIKKEIVVTLSKTSYQDRKPLHLVPEDLKQKIIECNPEHAIKFTLSQRDNTQMVIDNFLLKKKKGPLRCQINGRDQLRINWRCVIESCEFRLNTCDGMISISGQPHNHTPQPELVLKKEVRAHLKQGMDTLLLAAEEGPEEVLQGGSVSSYVADLVKSSDESWWDNMDGHKQAVRRLKRKYMGTATSGNSKMKKEDIEYIPE